MTTPDEHRYVGPIPIETPGAVIVSGEAALILVVMPDGHISLHCPLEWEIERMARVLRAAAASLEAQHEAWVSEGTDRLTGEQT